ncbi:hypothetical protein M426DRAFT_59427 [Hypoxylon sp. CI-4A]|nr:hypothetical protein M426DRAFT_59427 [Hypoxylon sp. CI-4A]
MAEPTLGNFPKPEFITGGCLCGSIRYKVKFEDGHDFLESSGSCQCTQCRRGTGSLFFIAHSVPLGGLEFLTSKETLKNFYATPGIQRGFCTSCGSFLYWHDESTGRIDITVGCVDPEFLSDFGFALANCAGNNVWCINEIKGVTDGMIGKERGVKFARSGDEGVRM